MTAQIAGVIIVAQAFSLAVYRRVAMHLIYNSCIVVYVDSSSTLIEYTMSFGFKHIDLLVLLDLLINLIVLGKRPRGNAYQLFVLQDIYHFGRQPSVFITPHINMSRMNESMNQSINQSINQWTDWTGLEYWKRRSSPEREYYLRPDGCNPTLKQERGFG